MKELVAIAENVAAKLIERRQTVAVAESSTGGLIPQRYSRCPAPPPIFSARRWSIPAMPGGSSWTSLMRR